MTELVKAGIQFTSNAVETTTNLRQMGEQSKQTQKATDDLGESAKRAAEKQREQARAALEAERAARAEAEAKARAESADRTYVAQLGQNTLRQRELVAALNQGGDAVARYERRWRVIDAQMGLSERATAEQRREVERLAIEMYEAERAADAFNDEQQRTQRQSQLLATGIRYAAAAATGFIVALGGREVLQTADNIERLRGRIDLYTSSAMETVAVMSELFDRSVQIGAVVTALGETYARLAPAQQALNLSSSQMLDVTEAVATAFLVSGASAQEAENATIQLSQGLASGVLRGEEYNAVSEQGARLTQALARQLNVSTGELREMAAAGELTADVVANALMAELPRLREEAEQLPVTIGRGFTSLRSAISETISLVNEKTGATSTIGEIFRDWALAISEFNDRLAETDVETLERIVALRDSRAEEGLSGAERFLAAWREAAELDFQMRVYQLRAAGVALVDLGESAAETTRNFFSLEAELASLDEQIAELEASTAAANDQTLEPADPEEIADATSAVSSFVDALNEEIEATGLSAEALAVLRAERELGRDLTEAEAEAIRDRARALEEARQAERRQAEAERLAERSRERSEATRQEIADTERLLDAAYDSVVAYDAVSAAIARENQVRREGLDLNSAAGLARLQELEDLDLLEDKLEAVNEERERESAILRETKQERERAAEEARRDLQQLAREVEKTSDQIAGLIGEGMINGFDDVLPKIERMLIQWAARLVLSPVIQPIVSGFMGGGGGLGGVAQLGGSGFGPGGLAGGLSGVGNAWQGFLGLGGGFGETGTVFGKSLGRFIGFGEQSLAGIGGAIGQASPYALIGSVLGGALGLRGSGNSLLDGGLNLGGAVAGQALGGSLSFLGAAGGPLGAVIGSVLGQALSGLFADKDYPYARSDIAIRNGRAVSVGGESLDGGSLSGAEKAVIEAINAALGALGVASDFSGGGTTFGVASGRSGALGDGFFAGSGGGFAGGATFTGIDDPEEAAKRAVAFAISQAVENGALGYEAFGARPFDRAMGVFEQNDFDIDASVADLNFIKDFESTLLSLEGSTEAFGDSIRANVKAQLDATLGPLRDFRDRAEELGLSSERSDEAIQSFVEGLLGLNEGESLNAAEQAIEAINAKFDALAEAASEFGVSLDQVEQGREKALEGLREDFLSGLEAASLQATGQGFILEGRSLFDQVDALREQAETYGEGMEEVDALAADLLAQLLTGLDAQQIGAIRDDLGERADEFSQVFENALNTITGDGGALDTSARALEQFTEELEARIRSLLETGVGGDINRIIREFTEGTAQATALGADPTLLLRRSILELQRAVEAASPEDFDELIAALDDVPEALRPSAEAIRAWAAEVEAATSEQEAAIAALGALQERIATEREAERLEAQLLQANANLMQSIYNAEASRLREIASLQEQTDRERIAQLENEARLFQSAAAELDRFLGGLSFSASSPLSLVDQLSEAQSSYDATLAAARGGDADAAGRLASEAERLLGLNAEVNRSGVAGSDLFEQIRSDLEGVQALAEQRGQRAGDYDARTASAVERQLDELRDLLGVNDDGFDGVRASLETAAAAAAAQGLTLQEFLASNSSALDVLANGGFADAGEFARNAFEAALEQLNLEEEWRAALDEAERLAEAATDALEQLLEGEGLSSRFEAILGSLDEFRSGFDDEVEELVGALGNAADRIDAAISEGVTHVGREADEVISGFDDQVGDIIRGLDSRIADLLRPLPSSTPVITTGPGAGGSDRELVEEVRRLREELVRSTETGNRLSAAQLDQLAELGVTQPQLLQTNLSRISA